MSDEHNNLNFEYDDQGDALLDKSEDQEEPMEVVHHRDEQPEDSLSLLMCGEQDIFSGDSFTDSQLVAAFNTPTLVDPIVPAWDAETDMALKTTPNFKWYQDVKEWNSALHEHCSEVQEKGQVYASLSPSPVESLHQEGAREEVEQRSHQSEPSDNIQEIVLEAHRIAS